MTTTNTTARRRSRTARRRRRKPVQPQLSLWERARRAGILSEKKVKRSEVISVTRELATLLDSGIGMGGALGLLAEQRQGSPMATVLTQLDADLNGGSTIAEAMGRHPEVFPRIYVRTVSSADRGAPLSSTLRQAVDFMDTAQSAMADAKRAMIYPMIIVMVGIGVVIMLMTVSLPQMIGLFQNLDTELPLPTRILIALSDIMTTHYLVIMGVAVVVGFGGIRFIKTGRGKMALHRSMLKIPMLRGVVISSDLSRASGALAALSKVGLPISEAMDVATETVGNEVIRQALTEARFGLVAGEGLAGPLGKSGIFPKTFIQTVKVAEETGTLDANLERMSEFYQQTAKEKVKAMVGMIEPLSTVGVALMVGFIALSVIMPMYSVLGSIEGN